MGLRRRFWFSFFGVPRGMLGRIGARLMTKVSLPFHRAMAVELALQSDDDLLDVGCGSGGLLVEQAGHVGFVAGLDASEIQVAMARRRLAERIAAGTAEVTLGDAASLPWEDERFSVITSVNALKFVPDPDGALRELHRVLRPGGRVAITMGEAREAPADPVAAAVNAWGEWQWSEIAAQRAVEDAGFDDVAVSVMPVFSKALLVRATKTAGPAVEDAAVAAVPVEAATA
jgi:ubiquinone/menaquinone biosynthesis C-methylase UbiE